MHSKAIGSRLWDLEKKRNKRTESAHNFGMHFSIFPGWNYFFKAKNERAIFLEQILHLVQSGGVKIEGGQDFAADDRDGSGMFLEAVFVVRETKSPESFFGAFQILAESFPSSILSRT